MTQFDVHVNPIARARSVLPYVCVMQSDIAETGTDRLVAFMTRNDAFKSSSHRLFPLVDVDDDRYVLLVPTLTNVRAKDLRTSAGNVGRHRDEIVKALDRLFLGV